MDSRNKYSLVFVLLIVSFCEMGCGVKGDPLPPERPPELGRGRPTYRRATEKVKLQKPEGVVEDEETDDSEDEE